MALRGTLTHRKTRRLAALLKIEVTFALGILEALWHVAGEQSKDGGIGRLSNQDIADEMFYSGDADELINALIKSGWLDESAECRLYIHDWHDYADDTTDCSLARSGTRYANGLVPRMKRLSEAERANLTDKYGFDKPRKATECHRVAQSPTESHEKPLPEPDPEPVPVPVIGIDKSILGGAVSKKPTPTVALDVAADVIAHLNKTCGKSFTVGGGSSKHLRARCKAAHSENDLYEIETACKLIVDHKFAEWGADPRMKQYLRPETLFGVEHWESYLQAADDWDDAGRLPISRARTNGKLPPETMAEKSARVLAEIAAEGVLS